MYLSSYIVDRNLTANIEALSIKQMIYSHNVYLHLQKLLHAQKRRNRIIESIQAHFGKQVITKMNESVHLTAPNLQNSEETRFYIASTRDKDYLKSLSNSVLLDEARTVDFLRNHASKYKSHADEQILFASRNAGQDTGRFLLQSNPEVMSSMSHLFQAIDSVWYRGLPDDNQSFVNVRPLGHVTVHWESNAFVEPCKQANTDPAFYEKIESSWISGILDVLSPKLSFIREFSIANGDSFGVAHFIETRRLIPSEKANLNSSKFF